MENKHWILELPMLKAFSLTVLIVHIIAIPLLFCLKHFAQFFFTSDVFKLVLITTSVGIVYTSCLFFVILVILIATKSQVKRDDIKIYTNILVAVLLCYFVGDVILVYKYLFEGIVIPMKEYLTYELYVLGGILLMYLLLMFDRKKKTDSKVNTAAANGNI